MAKDLYHELTKVALINDGWIITDDPLKSAIGQRQAFIDIGAKNLLAANRGERDIAVEIKSFLSPSLLEDLYQAVGQYLIYKIALEESHPNKTLYLALPVSAWDTLVADEINGYVERLGIKLLIFNQQTKQIERWIN